MKRKYIFPFLLFLLLLFSSCLPNGDIIVGSSSQIYECKSTQRIESCPEGLSSTLKSCYYLDGETKRWYRCTEGWILFEEEPIPVPPPPENKDRPYKSGAYHCYPSLGCCREHGLLTNECIPMGEVD